ncbi:TonB-dependent receptor [Sphingobacterium sp. N143]|uniref:outer membrane beta-barrel protein n=1 Tax=Sphingobacterium sp. N143 TaxID=2746727 RepID=UPI00257586A3|nr:outer membrane beta-barrel protein [Sphingobacterium sp. N143]MDM1293053.1 TonB-dependent receptor [Sphingobacterium sp. N143]
MNSQKKKLPLFILMVLFFFQGAVFGQSGGGKLNAIVVGQAGRPIHAASVLLLRSPSDIPLKGTLSKENGAIELQEIPEGKYTMQVSAVGYAVYRSDEVMLKTGSRLTLDTIRLQVTAQVLSEAQVIGKKPLIESQLDKIVLNVENSVLATGNNALELLQKVPGVTLDNKKINLRGKSNVVIMLDGKPTYLSADEVSRLLENTASNSIASIEVLTNPPAKYDAAGNAGIINIKTKKNTQFGSNVSLNLNLGQGKYGKIDGGFLLNHRNNWVNLFTSYNYNNSLGFNDLTIDRSVHDSATVTYFNSDSYSKFRYRAHNFKFAADFDLGKHEVLGFVVNGNVSGGNSTRQGTNLIASEKGKLDSVVLGSNFSDFSYHYLTYNLNYKKSFDSLGTELTANADYSYSKNQDKSNVGNRFLDADWEEFKMPKVFRNDMLSNTKILVFKTDFVHPFDKTTKFEAGLKYSRVKTDNNLIYANQNHEGEFVLDKKQSNRFLYHENIVAAYFTLNKSFGKFSVQTGLRIENTGSLGNSVTLGQQTRCNYTDFFPTLFMQQQINDHHKLGLSYSRRIDRPDYGALNPFIYYLDQYTYQYGNPYLNPQYTNSYELNYTFKERYLLNLGYKRTSDAITQVIESNSATKAIAQTDRNLTYFDYYNMNITVPVKLFKWWTTSNNASAFYSKYNFDARSGAPRQLEKLSFQVSSSHDIHIGETSSVELTANYFSPAVYGVFSFQSYYGVDVGAGKTLFDKKLNVKLAVNDILNTRGKRRLSSYQENGYYHIRNGYDSRVIRLSLSYRFGNVNIKSVNKRGGDNEEDSRLKK